MERKEEEIVAGNGKSEIPKDGSTCGFDSLHQLLQSSLTPQLFQEVSCLLLGLNCERALDTVAIDEPAKSLPLKHDFDLQHGGNVNTKDNTEQTALHCSAVRGSIAAADVLMQNGERFEAGDVNGYRAVHVAAQYGQTTFLNHIIAKHHADFDVSDNDGRSPLHWAAYKGYADTIRLLLFRDACQGRQDKEDAWLRLVGEKSWAESLVLT